MTVAIIGCGLIGRKRAQAVRELGHQITACCDIMRDRSEAMAREFGEPDCYIGTDRSYFGLESHYDGRRADVVIVCTPHDLLHYVGRLAAEQGSHVFLEKPGARRAEELDPLVKAAAANNVLVRVGYNLRFHPGVRQALEWLPQIGHLLYIKGYYGHGGRPGYEKEWRMNRWQSGGGVGMDLMSHLLDLTRVFVPELSYGGNLKGQMYWDSSVEDNLWLTPFGNCVIAQLHASWTEWGHNRFCYEIYGRKGKIQIDGLGGSYGTEIATLFSDPPGFPLVRSVEYLGPDDSWKLEMEGFLAHCDGAKRYGANLSDAQAVLRILGAAGCCLPKDATPDTV